MKVRKRIQLDYRNSIKLLYLSIGSDINGINLKWSFIPLNGRQLFSARLKDCQDEDEDHAIELHLSDYEKSKLARL